MRLRQPKFLLAAIMIVMGPAANACGLDGFFGGRHSPFGAMSQNIPNFPPELDSSGYPLLPSEQAPPPSADQSPSGRKDANAENDKAAKAADASAKARQSGVATAQAPAQPGKPTKD